MVTFFIVLLVISQMICFYFIILLNTKITKFNDLEVRQDRLIREMDDTITAYLLEMKEENDRFIQELSTIDKSVELKNEKLGNMNNTLAQPSVQQVAIEEDKELKLEPKSFIPKNIATNAYNRQKKQTKQQEQSVKLAEPKDISSTSESFENQVITLHTQGKTIEEIAKITQKGKTEIELLLKFHT